MKNNYGKNVDVNKESANKESGNNEDASKELLAVAEKIRAAYLETALNSYEDASANGLCAEGAWECAVDSMRHLKIIDLLQLLPQPVATSSDRRPNF